MATSEGPTAPHETSYSMYPTLPSTAGYDYRLVQVVNIHKYLEEERRKRQQTRKSYGKLYNFVMYLTSLLLVCDLALSLLTSFNYIPIVQLFAPICLGMTFFTLLLQLVSNRILTRMQKHADIELIARTKINSIQRKIALALEDGKVTEEEFRTILNENDNYEEMKEGVRVKYNKVVGTQRIDFELKEALIAKGKEQGQQQAKEQLRNELKKLAI